jgi:putative tryptophan/tyrosine transport system substrate-binding protein
MRRRYFIVLLGGTAAMLPLAARAQQPERIRRIGVLMGFADDPEALARVTAFRQGLEALGWTEGRNIRVEYRFAGGDDARVQAYVAELVNSMPDIIVAHSSPAVAALKQATTTIPIVFAVVNEPVSQGFVASLAQPGGNITGFSFIELTMVGKWLELIKELAPSVRQVALMFNPQTAPYYDAYVAELKAFPKTTLAAELAAAPVYDEAGVEATIAALAREPGSALIGAGDPFIVTHRALIIALAARYRLPAIYPFRYFVANSGLMSYGPDTADISRRSASYVDRILRGAKPADLPVQQPSKLDLVINLKTAKALGLTIPPLLLARADEVIE